MSVIDLNKFIDPAIWYAMFLLSVVLHEAAHAWSAHMMGDDTAYNGGLVTLNPYPHMKREFFGTVIVPFLTYSISGWMLGWGSAPYNPGWAYEKPKRSALMSLAGPLSNLLLAIIAAVLIRLGIEYNYFLEPERIGFTTIVEAAKSGYWIYIAKMISIMFSLNLILFVFNLIPIPPLDGSGVLPLFLPDFIGRKYLGLVNNRTLLFVGLFVAWQVMNFIYGDIFSTAIRLLYQF